MKTLVAEEFTQSLENLGFEVSDACEAEDSETCFELWNQDQWIAAWVTDAGETISLSLEVFNNGVMTERVAMPLGTQEQLNEARRRLSVIVSDFIA